MASPIEATLVIYPPVEWGGLFQRPQHLAISLSRYFRSVVYLEPAGLRNPHLKDIKRLRVLFAKRKACSTPLPRNLLVKRLPLIPLQGPGLVEKLNASILDALLSRLKERCNGGVILWVGAPAPFLRKTNAFYGDSPLVFDWMDDYALFRQLSQRVVSMQFELLLRADLVFTSSKRLLEEAEGRGAKRVFLLPNGVDIGHWRAGKRGELRGRLGVNGPIVGYFGTISEWMDGDLIREMALKRPGWNFVFIGPRADGGSLDHVFRPHNVFHVSQVNYALLPRLANDFDLCWMPFKINSLTEAINPVKIYEYLAMGKPVVSPPFPDLLGLEGLVHFARSKEEWINGLEKGLLEVNMAEAKRRRQEAIKRFQWSHIAKDAARALSASGLARF